MLVWIQHVDQDLDKKKGTMLSRIHSIEQVPTLDTNPPLTHRRPTTIPPPSHRHRPHHHPITIPPPPSPPPSHYYPAVTVPTIIEQDTTETALVAKRPLTNSTVTHLEGYWSKENSTGGIFKKVSG